MQVNNAAVNYMMPTTAVKLEEYKQMLCTNLDSGFYLSQLAHPLLKASGRGSIVFISSISSLVGFDGLSAYGAAKGSAQFKLVNGIGLHLQSSN